MSSAASLNATATIVNGLGITPNPDILAAITTYQNHTPIQLLANIYTNAFSDGNVAVDLVPVLNTIGNTATHGQFLLDVYPGNITPVSSPGIVYYGNTLLTPSLPSVSSTIRAQANYPFAHGLAGFAGGFTTAYGSASSSLDVVGSLYMLAGRTYGQSGIGYTGIIDLLTGGIGVEANLLGTIVSGWGTMYNVTNLNLIADPYVFGQNLLNQGLGTYGNLTVKLQAAGLNTTDITQAPLTGTSTFPVASNLSYSSVVGEITLPTVANTTVITTATGNNPSVVVNIYSTIAGSDLSAIISATGFTAGNAELKTLADFLDFTKVVGPTVAAQLHQYGVRTFADFSSFLHSRVGTREFNTWASLSTYLASISTPTLRYTTTTSSTPVLNTGTASTLSTLVGTGSGPFGNPVMSDYLGAVAGIPYNASFNTINSNYNLFTGTIITAMQNLDSAVVTAINNYEANINANISGNIDTSVVSTDIVALNAALSALTANTALVECQTAYYTMLNSLSAEVANLNRAGIKFTNTGSTVLLSFGQSVGSYGANDPSGLGANIIIGNLISNDANGDTIRAVIAESVNSQATGANDPNPRQAISQAKRQNIPLTTYLSQNK
jgi:hypothetical protein